MVPPSAGHLNMGVPPAMHGSTLLRSGLCGIAALLLTGCFTLLPADGGGTADFSPPRRVDAADVLLAPGYRIEPVTTGLTFPTGIAFDGQGRPHVIEAGYSYGEVFTTPRLLRLDPNGGTTVLAAGTGVPWTGVTFHDGAFYVAQGGGGPTDPTGAGAILRVGADGQVTTVVGGLPGRGDHHTNGPAISPDGWLYFAQGTATNAGVVGTDNYEFGWLERDRTYHDIPCRDVTLSGANFRSADPFAPGVRPPFKDDPKTVATGAFVPFGTSTSPGQVVKGQVPCSGAVMRVRPAGGTPELVAWGFRNPFGLAFAPDGRLYLTENSYDERGSRPVFGTGDLLWRVEAGRWYGWPDFHNGRRLDEENRAKSEPAPPLTPVIANQPGTPPKAAAVLGVHSSSNGLDFSRNPAFGHVGHAFVAQLGDQVPLVGKTLAPVGFKVVVVDPETGIIHDFASNKGKVHGPASWLKSAGLERPIDVQFTPDGSALYVVDFGVMTMSKDGAHPAAGTGVVWRVTRDGSTTGGR